MSREIKFRIIDTKNKIIWYPSEKLHLYFIGNNKWKVFDVIIGCQMFTSWDNPHVVLSEFTGLTDRKGKEIWEGDIIKDDIGRICIVEWWSNEACFIYKDIKDNYKYSLAGHIYDQVIGNIYENPTLLGKED